MFAMDAIQRDISTGYQGHRFRLDPSEPRRIETRSRAGAAPRASERIMMSRLAHVVVGAGLAALVPTGASAISFEIDLGRGVTVAGADTPSTFVAEISGGPVIAPFFQTARVQGTLDWDFVLQPISLFDSPNGDNLAVTGSLRHVNNNPDDGEHARAEAFIFQVSFGFSAPPNPLIALFPVGGGGFTDHPPHSDMFALSGEGGRMGNQITSWSATVRGTHVQTPIPEPSTLVLLGGGVISWLCCAWRRRH